MSKFAIGDQVGCSMCVPLFEDLSLDQTGEVLAILEATEAQKKFGQGDTYMVRFPNNFIEWLPESVTRVPARDPLIKPYKHFGHALPKKRWS
jgi:hypothetical protein